MNVGIAKLVSKCSKTTGFGCSAVHSNGESKLKLLLSIAIAISCLWSPVVAAPGSESSAAKDQASRPDGAKFQWAGWTSDLFPQAKRDDKLVLLDLEAVWCHWCHVMDQKTYSNPAVATVLSEHFIAVKVDQDSRPDLSNKYEDYGWPATIIFDSSGRELVKRSGFIRPEDMLDLLQGLVKHPVPEDEAAKRPVPVYSKVTSLPAALKKELVGKHRAGYDDKFGAWGTFHKFLDWDSVEYCLLRAKEGDAQSGLMAKQTLTSQLNLMDPVWGGVYQYSTDGDWRHPHFEKIMQIQAENLRIYSLGYLYFQEPKYLKAAQDIEKYLRTFLLSPEGAFYTSQDADLNRGQHSSGYFQLKDAERRKQGIPRLDKHIYARENGWAINGLVNLYMATADERYLAEAVRAANWIIKNRALSDGGFKHDTVDSAGPYLGDTLFMGRAFLSLYQATGDRLWLTRAEQCCNFIASHFTLPSSAGYASSVLDKSLVGSSDPVLDENICLARFANLLFQYSGQKQYKNMAENCMRYLSTPEIARKRRILVAGILLADKETSSVPMHVLVTGAKSDSTAKLLFQSANRYPLSYKRVDWFDKAEGPVPNQDSDYPQLPKAAAFVCVNQRCSLPVFSPQAVAAAVEKMSKVR